MPAIQQSSAKLLRVDDGTSDCSDAAEPGAELLRAGGIVASVVTNDLKRRYSEVTTERPGKPGPYKGSEI